MRLEMQKLQNMFFSYHISKKYCLNYLKRLPAPCGYRKVKKWIPMSRKDARKFPAVLLVRIKLENLIYGIKL